MTAVVIHCVKGSARMSVEEEQGCQMLRHFVVSWSGESSTSFNNNKLAKLFLGKKYIKKQYSRVSIFLDFSRKNNF